MNPEEKASVAALQRLRHEVGVDLEMLIERVVRQLDGEMPTSERWHRQLLSQAMIEVPGIRPEILAAGLEADLDALLRFRHFFRHAYGLNLDREKVKSEVERTLRIHPDVVTQLEAFDGYLQATIEELQGV